jgi:PadR family transcriptional regulator
MTSTRKPSPQATGVLAVLAAHGEGWTHGYDLARATGLKSGSLYPILARLADQGLLEAQWEQVIVLGRPPRHLYRLTPTGRAAVRDMDSQVRARSTVATGVREA